jgi:hypothetical protein
MRKHSFERGQTLPIVALAVLVLVAAAGFAADVGYHQYEQRVQQTATDSAALAGAAELSAGGVSAAQTAGRRDSASNGFTDGSNDVSVYVGPPLTGDPNNGNANAVEAQIVATYPTFFERVFGITGAQVTTTAVAVNDAVSDLCMIALDTTGTSTINGHSVVIAPNCDIAINNAHLSIGGQSTLTTRTPIQYSGSLTGSGTSSFLPSAPVPALPVSDPCPQITSCEYIKQNPPSTTPCVNFDPSNIPSGTITTYCSININNANVSFPPGVYVVTGDFKANNSTLTGTDVTFIDTSTNCPNLSSATLNFAAPASGNYAGMLFYGDQCDKSLTMNGGSDMTPGLSGVIYLPKANLTMNAGSTAAFVLITGQLQLNSANTTFSASPASSEVTVPRLVE